MFNYDCINDGNSYKAEDIKKWATKCGLELVDSYLASDLKYDYFDDSIENKPNPKAYYFVWSERNYMGVRKTFMQRDLEKSPRKYVNQ